MLPSPTFVMSPPLPPAALPSADRDDAARTSGLGVARGELHLPLLPVVPPAPVFMDTSPLLPVVPPAAVDSVMLPLSVAVPTPVVIVTAPPVPEPRPATISISPPVLVLVDEDADGSSDAPASMVSLPPVALLEVVLPAVSDMSPPGPVLPSPTFNVMSPPLPPTALPVLIEMSPLAPAVWESPVASSICRCCRWCRQRRSSWTRRRCCQMCHLQRSTASSRRCRLRCQHLS